MFWGLKIWILYHYFEPQSLFFESNMIISAVEGKKKETHEYSIILLNAVTKLQLLLNLFSQKKGDW